MSRLILALALLLLAAPASAAPKWKAPTPLRIAAGIHDGDAFGARLRPDGAWIAYGIREAKEQGGRVRWYARSLGEDGAFRSIWPNQNPSFEKNEGTASFSDLLSFAWHPEGRNNAMVVRHKTKGAEVMVEFMDVRFGGPGEQDQPTFDRDGSHIVVVAQGELGRELWAAGPKDGAELEQLTWTRDEERWPAWSPDGKTVLHEIRNRQTGRSDLFLYDFEMQDQVPALRLEPSDEVHPSWSPDGQRIAFLSTMEDPERRRYDLFVGPVGVGTFTRLVEGVVFDEDSLGYAWDPQGRFVVAVQAGPAPKLVVARADGQGAPKDLDLGAVEPADPGIVLLSEVPGQAPKARLSWTAKDPQGTAPWRISWTADVELAALLGLLGL